MSNENGPPGELFLLSAPSGAGKTTLIRGLLEGLADSGQLEFSVSHTTRPPRLGEVDGRDYHFVDDPTFERLVSADQFLEWAAVHGKRYGTSRQAVLPPLERGADVIVDIDVQGAEILMRRFPAAHTIFVLPPSYEDLVRRLHGRGLDDPAVIAQRLAESLREIGRYESYQYVIVNDNVERARRALAAIILEKRHRRARQRVRIADVLDDFERARRGDRFRSQGA